MSLKSRIEKLEKSTGAYDLGLADGFPILVTEQQYDEFNIWLDSLPD